MYTVAELVADPHVVARKSIVAVPDPKLGAVRMQAPTPRLSASPGEVRTTGPGLGEHNDAIYMELLGKTRGQLNQLRANRVI